MKSKLLSLIQVSDARDETEANLSVMIKEAQARIEALSEDV
jgi:hypothetical protein